MRALLRILYLLLNAVAVVALCCCLLTQFVNPNHFPFFELFGLAFPLIFLANICTSVVWILAKNHKKNFLFSFIPLLLSLPLAKGYFATQTDEELPKASDEIKVMSYNVMTFNYSGWRQNDNIKREIFHYIKKENPDVVCLQEFHHDLNEKFILLDTLKRVLGLKYVHYNKVYTQGDHYFIGNLICSRYPIVAKGKMNFQGQGNSAIWADIKKGSDTIRFFNSHLESYRLSNSNKKTIEGDGVDKKTVKNLVLKLFKAMKRRGIQTDELAIAFNESPHPIISCGDFNSPVCSYAYQTLRETKDLRDAFLEAGSGIGSTYNWWPHLRLDYILVSPQFHCRDFRKDNLETSDHYPISCVIAIEE